MRSCYALLALALLQIAPAWAKHPHCGYPPNRCYGEAKACRRECSSFMRTTVTPCPSTRTVTTTITTTGGAVTTTVTQTITGTSSFTDTRTSTRVTTVENTRTTTATTTVPATETVGHTTITVTTTATAVPLQKRAGADYHHAPALPRAPQPLAVQERHVASQQCQVTTRYPTQLPAAASACRSAAQFASACACAGIRGRTTTLAPSTVVVTSTATVRVAAPTVTQTSTTTASTSVTDTVTTVVPSTSATTVTTATVTDVVTTTTAVTATSTVVSTLAPTCTGYRLVAYDGQYNGQFLAGGEPDPSPGADNFGYVAFTPDVAQATTWVLRADGTVYSRNLYGWATKSSNFYVLQMTEARRQELGLLPMTCRIEPNGLEPPGATGTLQCKLNGLNINLNTCADSLAPADLQKFQGTPRLGCPPVDIAAIPFDLESCD